MSPPSGSPRLKQKQSHRGRSATGDRSGPPGSDPPCVSAGREHTGPGVRAPGGLADPKPSSPPSPGGLLGSQVPVQGPQRGTAGHSGHSGTTGLAARAQGAQTGGRQGRSTDTTGLQPRTSQAPPSGHTTRGTANEDKGTSRGLELGGLWGQARGSAHICPLFLDTRGGGLPAHPTSAPHSHPLWKTEAPTGRLASLATSLALQANNVPKQQVSSRLSSSPAPDYYTVTFRTRPWLSPRP